jgi:oligoribonuclease (3'-5' exoribonuclease)
MIKMWFDTETGGLNPDVHDILTAYFAITDNDHIVIDDLCLQLKPTDIAQLNVEQQALNVNGINLQQHLNDPNTVTYEEGANLLLGFFTKNLENGRKRTIQPCGHNIALFDLPFVWNKIIPRAEWEKVIHYRALDSLQTTIFLKDVGILPDNVGTLSSLARHYNIPVSNAHNAKGDVLMNIQVYKEMTNQIKALKGNMATNINSSLLEIIEM